MRFELHGNVRIFRHQIPKPHRCNCPERQVTSEHSIFNLRIVRTVVHSQGESMMRRCSILCALVFLAPLLGRSQSIYDRYFTRSAMRADYFHTGTKGTETFSLDQICEEGLWPGSTINLVDTLNLGEYYVNVYDTASRKLLFSRGYSSVFFEWQTTDEALSGTFRTFHESVRFPFPRHPIRLAVTRRDDREQFNEIFSVVIDPGLPTAVNRERKHSPYNIISLMDNGSPNEKVDLLILGDGYRADDMKKFREDAKHFNDVMFSKEPFKSRKSDFNVRAVEVVSPDSGIDKPDWNVWKSTTLGTHYNSFGSARYVLTEENRAIRTIAGAAPYDFLLILVNDNRYGGGGIYNQYVTCYTQTDSPGMEWLMEYVYVHEFGHSFAALGDEYYSSQVSFNDMHKTNIEPWQPNLTALLDKNTLKWKGFVEPNTPLPTPWEKETYDSLGREVRKLDRLAPGYYQRRKPFVDAEVAILATTKYKDKVGAFDGAGYVAHGLYRPAADCIMFTQSAEGFDPVCAAAITRVIDFYSH